VKLQLRSALLILTLSIFAVQAVLAEGFWGEAWPNQCDPKVVGKRLAMNLIDRKEYYLGKTGGLQYPEVCTAYGAMRFAGTTQDKGLLDKLVKRYESIKDPSATVQDGKKLTREGTNVDTSVFGALPLEIYIQTGDKAYLPIGLKSADHQWENPREDGLTTQTRFWIDDMFMITGLQVQAYRATKDAKYLDRAAREMVAYLDKLQQPNGLFYHGEGSDHYWGRGDGWVAVGMAEILSSMPSDHPQRARIVEGYKKMMDALVKNQATDGAWRQLIDQPDSWPESSCTGMFTFAMAMGVKNGWLQSQEYKTAARKGWLAVCGFVDNDANVRDVCVGTNKNPDKQFYLDRPRKTGDLHGQAAAIWAAWAMLDPQ
jgi:rhamnogalacturonyl hydrolase YesR